MLYGIQAPPGGWTGGSATGVGSGATSASSAAASGLGAVLGGPVGAGLALGGLNLLGGAASFGFGQAAVGKSWDKWKDSQTRGFKYKMIGLRKAGLNPILAAQGGLGGGSGGFAPPAQASGGTGLPIGTDAVKAYQQSRLQKSQRQLMGAQANLATQNKAQSRAATARELRTGQLLATQNAKTAAERDTALFNAQARSATSAAEIQEADVRSNVAAFYKRNPNVAVAKDLAGAASSAINSLTNFVRGFSPTSGGNANEETYEYNEDGQLVRKRKRRRK